MSIYSTKRWYAGTKTTMRGSWSPVLAGKWVVEKQGITLTFQSYFILDVKRQQTGFS